jgi:hypothetical protein
MDLVIENRELHILQISYILLGIRIYHISITVQRFWFLQGCPKSLLADKCALSEYLLYWVHIPTYL